MEPIRAIARDERRRLLRDGRLASAAMAFLVLLACSIGASVVETRRSIRAAETQSRAERERWLNESRELDLFRRTRRSGAGRTRKF
jgi:hypothetical protein